MDEHRGLRAAGIAVVPIDPERLSVLERDLLPELIADWAKLEHKDAEVRKSAALRGGR